MADFKASRDPGSTNIEPGDDGQDSQSEARSLQSSTPRFHWQRWSAIGGLILLIFGLGFGWRWWQALQAGNQGNAPFAGKPMGMPVTLETTKLTNVRDSSEYVGSLESQKSVLIQPEVAGRVSAILVKPGDRVQAGTPLVQLKPDRRQAELSSGLAAVNSARAVRANALSQLQALQADRTAKEAEVRLQDEEYRRISVLVTEGALAQQQLDRTDRDRRKAASELRVLDRRIQASRSSLTEAEAELQRAKANADLASVGLNDTRVVAPFAGVVGDVPIRLGQMVETKDTLTTVTQNQQLDLKLSVPLERAPDLKEGLPVELIDADGRVISRGRISFISPKANTQAQSILVKASFDNSQGTLRDGQFVRARIIWNERPGILIPTAAISRLGGATFVFVAQPPAAPVPGQAATAAPSPTPVGSPPALIAKQTPVKLGSIQDNRYLVLEGLRPGEQVVVSGVLNLIDGVPITPKSDTPPANTPPK